ncbi:calcium-binding protein [Microbulbifer sp. GL-2]|uniref:calcium-binding protein n=1 Tax=Microbulbifer sp. GL-2 TaxID=2591606 RepID=UPI0011636D76|nr:calcium-binding protein [Microbulbifer sp. GL-2]BBM04131.1 hypothetical protein GL2_42050 [Microbulbifer sp. GL-2]
MTVLSSEEVTNLYLYGTTNTPSDLANDSYTRTSGAGPTQHSVNINDYMDSGPGRFASPAFFEIVKLFFSPTTSGLPPGRYKENDKTFRDMIGTSEAIIKQQQWAYDDGAGDYEDRVYVWNTVAFEIDDNATFVIDANGNRYIENFAVIPFSNTGTENFDFGSDDLTAILGNPFLEKTVDPSGIGHQVEIGFTGSRTTTTYTYSDYQNDTANAILPSPLLLASLYGKMETLTDRLFANGVTQFLDGDKPLLYGSDGNDELSGYETVTGVDLSDHRQLKDKVQNGISYFGGAGDDTITGTTYDDKMDGGTGKDTLSGEDGNDEIKGKGGDDIIYGGKGEDTIEGDEGNDQIEAGDDDDTVLGGEGKDTIEGGNGEDVIEGGQGEDTLYGDDGNDTIKGDEENDEIRGGEGDDTLYGGSGDDLILGGNGNDDLYGDEGADILTAGDGNDRLNGGDGNDILSGNEGDDRMMGGDGDDEVLGGGGSDILAGGKGSDTIRGDVGRDALGGGAYYDKLNDIYWLQDDFVSDRLEGGNGYDFYFVDTLDVINDLDGRGTIYFQSSAQGDLPGYAGGLWWRLSSAYETEYGSGVFESHNRWTGETLQYSLSGSTLSINGEVTVEGYSDGDLGIRLIEKSKPKPPPLPNPPPTPASPLILDLDGDGIETIGQDQNVHFDLDNSGFSELTGWVAKDDGLLVFDKNNNGLIDNGSELFGNNTALRAGNNAENGFVALAELDSNLDGIISSSDDNFNDLRVWQDVNSNGVVDSGELKSLQELNIAELGLAYRDSNSTDVFGNAHAQIGSYKLGNGVEREMTDVWFDTNTQDNGNTDSTSIPDDIAELPGISGSGNVASLHIAMANDESGQLKALVEQFSQANSVDERSTLLESILFQWVGETGEYEQHYQSLIDRRKIHTLEAFYGYELPDPRGGGWQYTELYERLFQQFSSTIYSQLVGQTHLKEYYDTIVYTSDDQGETTINFDVLTEKLLYDLGDFTEADSQDLLAELYLMIDGLSPYEGTSFSNNEGQSITAFKQQVRDYIGIDIIDTLFEGYIGQIDQDLEAKLRLSAERLLNFVAGATMYDDQVVGTSENDWLNGLMGDDEIEAGAGDDTILGGLGDDRLKGGLGKDQYVYSIGDGNDSIYNDSSDNAADSILIHGITESELILNRQGDDLLIRFQNTGGSIRVEGQFTNEGVNNHHVQELVLDDGSKIDIRVDTFNSVNQDITENSDVYHATLNNDSINTLGGDDALFGKGGDDNLSGGAGNDRIYGDEGDDTIVGGDGHDFLFGGDGDDVLIGGTGNDILRGNEGNDRFKFNLGDGIDALSDGDGNNIVELGEGITATDLVGSRSGNDLILDFVGNSSDQITLSEFFKGNTYSQNWSLTLFDGSQLSSVQLAQLTLIGTENSDSLTGLYTDNTIIGNGGNDTINGNQFSDTIIGGKGDDTLKGGRGSDTYIYTVGDGHDFVQDYASGDESNVLKLGAGIERSDLLIRKVSNHLNISLPTSNGSLQVYNYFAPGDQYQISIELNDGSFVTYDDVLAAILVSTEDADVIHAMDTSDVVHLLGGDDSAYGQGGDDQIYGQDGNDHILGGDGSDTLLGGLGQDNLAGEAGDDHVDGGAGNDAIDGGAGNDTLLGGDGQDILNAGEGDDVLNLGEGDDIAYGGYGNDTYLIANVAGTNTIWNIDYDGENSIDTIQFAPDVAPDMVALVRNGNDLNVQIPLGLTVVKDFFISDATDQTRLIDVLKFEDGTTWDIDSVKLRVLAGTNENQELIGYDSDDNISAGAGNDIVKGNSGNDQINGEDGDDTLYGGLGNDVLAGGKGNDLLKGDAGDDQFVYSNGEGNDSITDSSGSDSLYLPDLNKEDLIFRRVGDAMIVLNKQEESARQINHPESQKNVLLRIEGQFNSDGSIPGTAIDSIEFSSGEILYYADILSLVLTGTDLRDEIEGHALNDVIQSGAGDDQITAADGDDQVDAGLGDDVLIGGNGNDYLNGAEGNDDISGDSGSDTLYGEAGDDTLKGGNGDDVLYGGAGQDRLYGNSGNDILNGGDDNDELYGNGILSGDAGDDYIEGSGQLNGGAGNDYLQSLGEDTLSGGDGNDTLVATTDVWDFRSNDMTGGKGDDTLYGSNGSETYRFNLGDGKDLIIETRPDEIFSNIAPSNDVLIFGDGISANDLLFERHGNDMLIKHTNGSDQITIQNWFVEFDTRADYFKINEFQFFDGSTLTDLQVEDIVVTHGTSGKDILTGYRQYDDEIHGGEGNDEVWGREGNDTIYGDAGDDYLDGDEGDDHLLGGEGADNLVGRVGNDTLEGQAGNDSLQGMEGNDTLKGGDGQDKLTGGAGDDQLEGGNDRDLINGDAGNDTLDGGAGDDQLTGGEGNDHFIAGTGDDMIVVSDNHGHDTLDVSAGGVNGILFSGTLTRDRITFNQDGDDLLIQIDDGSSQAIRVLNHFLGGEYAIDWVQPSGDSQIATDKINQLAAGQSNGEFDSVIIGADSDEWLSGTSGSDLIQGLGGNDILVGNGGDDRLEGGDGNDRYYYYSGNGKDTILDDGDGQDVLFFNDVAPDRLSYHQDGNDLIVLVDGDFEQQVRVENHFLGGDYEIMVQPNGGFTLTPSTIASQLTTLPSGDGSPGTGNGGGNSGGDNSNGEGEEGSSGGTGIDLSGDNDLTGTSGNDVLISGEGSDSLAGLAGNDRLVGGVGNDTYIIGAASGQDIIVDVDGQNRIRFVDGITFNDVASGLYKSGDDLTLHIGGSSNQVTIRNFFSLANTIEIVEFETGGQLTADQLFDVFGLAVPTATGSPANNLVLGDGLNNTMEGDSTADILLSGQGDDTLYGKEGDDQLYGGAGNDTYLIGANSGKDTVIDTTGTNIIRFVDGIGFNDVATGLTKSGDDLILNVAGDTNQVLIENFFAVANTIERLEFESGGQITAAQLFHTFSVAAPTVTTEMHDPLTDIYTGGDGNDTLTGSSRNDQLTGGKGDDILNGGAGSDRYFFSLGDGQDTITENSPSTDTDVLDFGSSVSIEELWFSRSNDDLKINVEGSDDQVTVSNWYGNTDAQLDEIEVGDSVLLNNKLEQLVTAMASYTVPSGAGNVITQETKDELSSTLAATWQGRS